MVNETALFIDVHNYQRRKWNQNVCGDAFTSRRFDNEERLIAVLSDGLGSGVKANILSSMTAAMALKFFSANKDILRSAEVIMETLPVCQVRKISYATFSVVDCDLEGTARVVEEGNPEFILLRGGIEERVKPIILESKRFPDRRLHVSEMSMSPGDRIIVCSDGVTQAGMGTPGYPLGWRRESLVDFAEGMIREDPTISSRRLSQAVVEASIETEPLGKPLDDTSCLVLYFRTPRRLMVFSGPPFDPARDAECGSILDSFPGRKAICGGTTANLVAREWGCRIDTQLPKRGCKLPPCSQMDGVDLVTEGVLTLTQVARRLEEPECADRDEPADRLIELLLDSDAIEFMVGTKINEAHQDPNLPVDLEIRRNIIKRIAAVLSERYLKKTSIRFI